MQHNSLRPCMPCSFDSEVLVPLTEAVGGGRCHDRGPPYAVHAMADEPRPSRRPPRDERGARGRLGAVSVGMDVFGGLCWGLSSVPSAPPLVVRSAPPAV